MTRVGIRAVAILRKDNKILLIHRSGNGKEFWVLPGGGKEENESVEEAVVREVEEEASIKCKIIKPLYTHVYSDLGHKQYYYLCEYISGKPKLGDYNEVETMKNEDQTYEPRWVDVKKLPDLLLYPLEIRNWLIEDLETNFMNTPRKAEIDSTDLLQKID